MKFVIKNQKKTDNTTGSINFSLLSGSLTKSRLSAELHQSLLFRCFGAIRGTLENVIVFSFVLGNLWKQKTVFCWTGQHYTFIAPSVPECTNGVFIGNSNQYLLITQPAMTKSLHSQVYEAVLLWATSTKRQGNMQVSAVGLHGNSAAITYGEEEICCFGTTMEDFLSTIWSIIFLVCTEVSSIAYCLLTMWVC